MKKETIKNSEHNPTITAISTPLGEAGLGIIRLSGPEAIAIVDCICEFPSGTMLKTKASHTLCTGTIHNQKKIIDRVMVSVMKAPRTYTGEDMVEITTHGSPVIMKQVMNILLEHGAQCAEPGEFTKRAYLNGKVDLVQAEAVADLIHAKTMTAARAAHEQLSGGVSHKINELKKVLISLIAQIEVRLDHPDEDIESASTDFFINGCTDLAEALQSLISTAVQGKIISHGVRLAIIGKPNAGKSSLLNALIERERSIVTDEPGTTRDTVDAEFQLNGIPVRVIDTAGIRSHAFSKAEHLGMERSRKAAEESDIILAVFDVSVPLSPDDRAVIDMTKAKRTICVLNKTDIPKQPAAAGLRKLIKKYPAANVSALHHKGISSLRTQIVKLLSKDFTRADSDVMITNIRHEQALQKAFDCILKAKKAVKDKEPDECMAFELNEALNALDEITGKTASEAILDNIFSTFCIGK